MQDKVWITARGERLLISKMDTSHIINCIRLMQRKKNWRRGYLDRLLLELDIRNVTQRG
jgi:hypothetical protein